MWQIIILFAWLLCIIWLPLRRNHGEDYVVRDELISRLLDFMYIQEFLLKKHGEEFEVREK